jgi:tetratricopeptide (TPR) repeat protein
MNQDLTHTLGPMGTNTEGLPFGPPYPPGYELAEEIGRGGMGIVYRARDSALDRDVAVKLLSDRYPPNSQAAQRFLNEARITGQLQHPGIPAVHQVGTLPDGRPFLAMKLIKGSTLEEILKHRSKPVDDHGRMLTVFEAACQAVGYAHAHRVIHRDLKPANVMVGAFGEVQLMDWGLAKVLGKDAPTKADPTSDEQTLAWTEVSPTPEAASHTQAGSLVGTPAYISPEQAGGETERIDERADVFGLGALLTVILTGKPPYVAESPESVRLLAVRGKLEECYGRLDACGAEPELIALCKRCLAFEPTYRPCDGGAVAQAVADLRSAAEERARIAERDKAAADARAEEQGRKRRWQYAAAAAVVFALTAGILGLVFYLHEQARANTDLAAKNTELEAANERERQRFSLAVDAIGLLTGNIGQDLLLQQKEFDGLRTRLLKGAADFYGKLESQLRDRNDPASRAALARAYFELGELTDNIGSKDDALAIHRKALAIRRDLSGTAGADMETRLDVGRSLGRMGTLLLETGDPAGGLRAFEEQLTVALELEKESPHDEVRIVLAQGQLGTGNVLYRIGKAADALVSYEKAGGIQKNLADAHPAITQFQNDLAKTFHYTSRVLIQMGKPSEALGKVQAARAIQQKLADAHSNASEFQFELAKSHHEIGWQLYLLGKTAEGLASGHAARTIFQKLADAHPAVTEFQFQLAESHNEIGELLYTSGKQAEGLASVQAGQVIFKKLADDHPTVPKYRIELMYSYTSGADALRRLGRREEAKAACQAAIAEAQVLVQDQPTLLANRSVMAWSLRVLGLTRLADGDAAHATGDLRRALELYDGLPTRSGELWFETACCHAALSALAGREGSGVPATDKPIEADKTLALLKKAIDMGYRAETFRTEPSLETLRERDEFRKLIAGIEALSKAEAAMFKQISP